jgi:transposase InsO family protein
VVSVPADPVVRRTIAHVAFIAHIVTTLSATVPARTRRKPASSNLHPMRSCRDRRCHRTDAHQRPRRALEQAIYRRVLAFRRWRHAAGDTDQIIADHLDLSPRTMRSWGKEREEGIAEATRRRMAESGAKRVTYTPILKLVPRGRPMETADVATRDAVIAMIHLIGPLAITRAMVEEQFPDLARNEIDDLIWRYRSTYQRMKPDWMGCLRWLKPGTVWAMDFSKSDHRIDGQFGAILVIRDLASGTILLSLPAKRMDAATVYGALVFLFATYGPPLVLKCDNGSHFTDGGILALCRNAGIFQLFSPVATPTFNGSIEAGIGSIKTYAHYHAVGDGHPERWTCDDIEAARIRVNIMPRVWDDGWTAIGHWERRTPITPEQRHAFKNSVDHYAALSLAELCQRSDATDLTRAQSNLARASIARACVACGLLKYRRRRLTLANSGHKVAGIS